MPTWMDSLWDWAVTPSWFDSARGVLIAAVVVVLVLVGLAVWIWRRWVRSSSVGEEQEANGSSAEDALRERLRSLPLTKDFDFTVPGDAAHGVARQLTAEQETYIRQNLLIKPDEGRVRSVAGGLIVDVVGGREALVLDSGVLGSQRGAHTLVKRRPALPDPGEVRVDLRWPDEVLIDDRGRPRGYFAKGLPDQTTAASDAVDAPPTLAAIVMGDPERNGSPWAVNVLRAVALWLRAQHEVGVINGQVDPQQLLVDGSGSLITPSDYRYARPFGSGGWTVNDGGGSFDDDRRGFAAIAWLLLCPPGSQPESWAESRETIADLDDVASMRVRSLLRRSLGPAGTMPSMEEWRAALG